MNRTMMLTVTLLHVLCAATVVFAGCPWKNKKLVSWGDPSAWASNSVPVQGEKAVIAAGKQVLYDVNATTLGTLTVEAGGVFVWGDVDGLVLSAHNILVHGEFHIGAEDCRFTKKATIRLLGKTDDTHVHPTIGRKFIAVESGGVLELHGKEKTAWTKLAQTIPAAADVSCGIVYDHTTSPVATERGAGLHVIIWNEDGSLMDFSTFSDFKKFDTFFASVPSGKVVGAFVFGSKGLSSTKGLASVITGWGGSAINNVGKEDSYSFLGRMGESSSVKESHHKYGQKYPRPADYLSLHGAKDGVVFQVASSYADTFNYFRVLREEVGFPILTLLDEPVGWEEGDQILITSTDFDWNQAETKRIIPCGAACTSKRQIRVDGHFKNLHYGNFTYNIDERAEVALLSRNILIEGVTEQGCYYHDKAGKALCDKFHRDTFGGHLKVLLGVKSARIEGVELNQMGQQSAKGSYPLHFHMCDGVKGMYMRQNSVHHSFSRCFTIHGTHFLNVSDNVCYLHMGHGLFVEDGVEQNNTISGNLIAGTVFGTILLSDSSKEWCKADKSRSAFVENCGDLSSYWLTHPNNDVFGNVAAGGKGKGFMYVFSDRPLGPSFEKWKTNGWRHHPKDYPLYFTRNVAHSNDASGVFMDSKVSTGTGMENKGMVPENGVIQTENEYDAHDSHNKSIWVEMSYGTYYKNGNDNMWIKGGDVRISHSALADAPEGISGGTTLFDTGTEIYKSIFIGETENKGLGRKRVVKAVVESQTKSYSKYFDQSFPGQPYQSLTGVGIYQGPILIRYNFFDKYVTRSWCLDDESSTECDDATLITRYAGAISFKRNSNYPSMTSSYVEGNTFGFCDNAVVKEDRGSRTQHYVFQGRNGVTDWLWKDGNKMIYFFDRDGSLTGVENSSVVMDYPLYKGPECLEKEDWGDLMICPYRYVKLEILGTGGNLQGTIQKDYPIMIRRDDSPYNNVFFSVKGEIRNEHLLRTHKSYLINFNGTNKNAAFPSEMKFMGYGVESQDVVRVGICQPKDVDSFEIFMDYPVKIKNNATWVKTLKELDEDTTGDAWFYDKTNGILFFKLISFHNDNNETQQCPAGHCWKVKIKVIGGSKDKMRSCDGIKITPYEDKRGVTPTKPTHQDCSSIDKPEPGVGPIDLANPGFVVTKKFEVPCLESKPTRGTDVGCFAEKVKKEKQTDILTTDESGISKTMTVDFCVERCYGRGYRYAALGKGRRCTCGNTVIMEDRFKAAGKCSIKCPGNAKQMCGGKKEISVWDTGFSAGA